MKAMVAWAATSLVACTHVQDAPAAVNPPLAVERCDERVAAAVESTRAPLQLEVVEARQHAARDRGLVIRQLEDLWTADNALSKVQALEEELGNVESAAALLENQRLKPAELAETMSRLAARLLEIKQDLAKARGRAGDALHAAEKRYVDTHGVPSALAAGVSGYQEACDKGDVHSCVRLGQAYEHGAGIAADPTWAVNLYASACQGGDGYGCRRAGLLQVEGGPQSVRNPAKGMEALQRGCTLNDAEACARLAVAFEVGEGRPADPQRSAELDRQACLGGVAKACVRLALKRLEGAGVGRDLGQAESLLTLACEAGDPFACSHLGEMFLLGNGVSMDRGRGRQLLEKGCAGGNAWACKVLAK